MRGVPQTIDSMRATLLGCVGSTEPFWIRQKNDEVVVSFIRGFADTEKNIVLISEKKHSLGMHILEIKNIQAIMPCTPSIL